MVEQAFVAPYMVARHERPRLPFVFASPHSGAYYPQRFLDMSCQDKATLRRSEDAYVDQLITGAFEAGMLTLAAVYPRSMVDLNRHPGELDANLFYDADRAMINEKMSVRTQSGYGLVPSIVAQGIPIYGRQISFDEVRHRLTSIYNPYHDCLGQMMDDAYQAHGRAYLVDCHSMPSWSAMTMAHVNDDRPVDIILGDRFGKSCAPEFVMFIEQHFKAHGLSVIRNVPYAGGFCTEHYGNPYQDRHSVQIEINRSLYMDEQSMVIKEVGMRRLKSMFSELYKALEGYHHYVHQGSEAAE